MGRLPEGNLFHLNRTSDPERHLPERPGRPTGSLPHAGVPRSPC